MVMRFGHEAKLQRDYPPSPYVFQSSRSGPLAHDTVGGIVEFVDFLTSSAIVHHQMGGTFYKTHHVDNAILSSLSGLSVYLPETQEEIDRWVLTEIFCPFTKSSDRLSKASDNH
jgi:hypothetical protein